MQVPLITTASQYARLWSLQTRWRMKKDSGTYSAHTTSLRDALVPAQSEEDRKLSEITSKVQAGVKLTREEMELLRRKNPQLYMKLQAIEEEQKEYEKELRRCKTQDQVQRLHTMQTVRSLQMAKEGDSTALYRLNRMTESEIAFTKTEEYKKLPTEAEEAVVRGEVRQARQEALREALEDAASEKRAQSAPDAAGEAGEHEQKPDERLDAAGEKAREPESPLKSPEGKTPAEAESEKTEPVKPKPMEKAKAATAKPALAELYRQAEEESQKSAPRKRRRVSVRA